eukprot:8856293-Pyramimonas_sp.AAC.1
MLGCWNRGAAKGLLGTTVPEVLGTFGGRHELALAANSGTMINGMLNFSLEICSNTNIIGFKTAQHFEQ